MSTGYSIAGRGDALDFMAAYPGYGEQRWYSDALGTEQVSFSWRRMPPATGGRSPAAASHAHSSVSSNSIFISRRSAAGSHRAAKRIWVIMTLRVADSSYGRRAIRWTVQVRLTGSPASGS